MSKIFPLGLSVLLHLLLFIQLSHVRVDSGQNLNPVQELIVYRGDALTKSHELRQIHNQVKSNLGSRVGQEQQVSSRAQVQMASKFKQVTNEYLQQLHQYLVQHKKYPPIAKRLGLKGEVKMRLLLEEDGQFHVEEILQSSGSSLMDSALKDQINALSPFKAPPAKDEVLLVDVSWVLDQR